MAALGAVLFVLGAIEGRLELVLLAAILIVVTFIWYMHLRTVQAITTGRDHDESPGT